MPSVLLIIGGGIAAYKSLELIRLLKKAGTSVTPVLTRAAQEFITPLSATSLAGEKAHTDLFSATDEAEMGHIALSRAADLVVVAPATADLMAKMSQGLANDLASTLLLATDKRVLIAPAMNVRMWEHPATQRNIQTLKSDAISFVGPHEGDMACGEYGAGRMAEPEEILAAVQAMLAERSGIWVGKSVLITSGPTYEPLDPVRYLANRSSGRQGHALAEAFVQAGAHVTLVSGPVALPDPFGAKVVRVETAQQMLDAVDAALPADVFISAAAVADWTPEAVLQNKLKKSQGIPQISFKPTPDILHHVAMHPSKRPALVVGFAAETDNVLDYAAAKLSAKGVDVMIANDVSPEKGVMGGTHNSVHVLTHSGTQSWPHMKKELVAQKLVQHLAGLIQP